MEQNLNNNAYKTTGLKAFWPVDLQNHASAYDVSCVGHARFSTF